MNMSWLKVVIAAFFEVLWVIGLKHAYSFWTWVATILFILISFYLMIVAAKKLPIGTVYAVFVGLGTVGVVVAEMIIFHEPFQLVKVLLIILLLTGVIGLKMITKTRQEEGGRA